MTKIEILEKEMKILQDEIDKIRKVYREKSLELEKLKLAQYEEEVKNNENFKETIIRILTYEKGRTTFGKAKRIELLIALIEEHEFLNFEELEISIKRKVFNGKAMNKDWAGLFYATKNKYNELKG